MSQLIREEYLKDGSKYQVLLYDNLVFFEVLDKDNNSNFLFTITIEELNQLSYISFTKESFSKAIINCDEFQFLRIFTRLKMYESNAINLLKLQITFIKLFGVVFTEQLKPIEKEGYNLSYDDEGELLFVEVVDEFLIYTLYAFKISFLNQFFGYEPDIHIFNVAVFDHFEGKDMLLKIRTFFEDKKTHNECPVEKGLKYYFRKRKINKILDLPQLE